MVDRPVRRAHASQGLAAGRRCGTEFGSEKAGAELIEHGNVGRTGFAARFVPLSWSYRHRRKILWPRSAEWVAGLGESAMSRLDLIWTLRARPVGNAGERCHAWNQQSRPTRNASERPKSAWGASGSNLMGVQVPSPHHILKRLSVFHRTPIQLARPRFGPYAASGHSLVQRRGRANKWFRRSGHAFSRFQSFTRASLKS